MDSKQLQTSDEIDIVTFIAPIVARWKLLLVVSILGGLAGLTISMIVPKTYQSKATIFVQQSGGVTSILKDLPIALGSSSSSTSSGYLMTLLQSDTLLKIVRDKLHLYPDLDAEMSLEKIRKSIDVRETKGGTIAVEATAKNAKLAASIVNTMLDNLGSLVVTASKRKADFISQKTDETSQQLVVAEDRLKDFLEKHDLTSIEEDAKVMIQQSAEIEANILLVNQELETVKSELANSAELDSLVDKEVKKRQLESSRDYAMKQLEQLRARIAKLPSVGAQYARLQRDVTVLGKTYELLVQQLQLANITRKGEDGDYQIVDRAEPNYKSVAPRKGVNAVVGALLCLFVAIFVINMRSGADKQRDYYRTLSARRSSKTEAEPIERS